MLHCKTKQIKASYKSYLNSNYYELYHCYDNYSYYKAIAFENCRDLMQRVNGYGLKIISFNSQCFTVGFIGEMVDEKTGAIEKAFFYITRDYDRFIFLDEIN